MKLLLLLCLPVLSLQTRIEIKIVQVLNKEGEHSDEATDSAEEEQSFNLGDERQKLEILQTELEGIRNIIAQVKGLEIIVGFAGQSVGILVQVAQASGPGRRRRQQMASSVAFLKACQDPAANFTGSVQDAAQQTIMGILTELQTIAVSLQTEKLLCYTRSAMTLSRGILSGSLGKVDNATLLLGLADQVNNAITMLVMGSANKKEEIQQAFVAKMAEIEAQMKVIAAHSEDTNGVTPPVSVCQPQPNTYDIHFLLWTRENNNESESYELVPGDCTGLAASPFNSSMPTYIIAHGWTQSGRSGWPLEAKIELLKYNDCNVISVDWATIASGNNYFAVLQYIPLVGQHTASLLNFLHDEAGLDITTVHIIGLSFGAQIAGLTANYVMNGPIGRITGLDPAGPDFENASNVDRLDSSDADFVEIIHTNGCPVLSYCLGIQNPVGHVDYYVNGGEHQPGCNTFDNWEELLTDFCSHGRAVDYWLESINGGMAFRSVPCSDWNTFNAGNCSTCGQGCLEMGLHASTNLSGTYYLRTNATKPFAKG